jgi:hypothetical protein
MLAKTGDYQVREVPRREGIVRERIVDEHGRPVMVRLTARLCHREHHSARLRLRDPQMRPRLDVRRSRGRPSKAQQIVAQSTVSQPRPSVRAETPVPPPGSETASDPRFFTPDELQRLTELFGNAGEDLETDERDVFRDASS